MRYGILNSPDWREFACEYQTMSGRALKVVGALALATVMAAYACDFGKIRTSYPIEWNNVTRAMHQIARD